MRFFSSNTLLKKSVFDSVETKGCADPVFAMREEMRTDCAAVNKVKKVTCLLRRRSEEQSGPTNQFIAGRRETSG